MPDKKEEGTLEEVLPSFSMKYLPDYFKEKAQRELNETPERKITGLEELKELARDHKLTCDIDFVDDFLVQFLRHRKYDVSRAFKQLLNFVSFRMNHSSFFSSIDDDKFFSDPRRQFCTILPFRCPDGCVIALVELGKWDPKDMPFHVFWQLGAMLGTQALRDPMTQINGFKIIYNFKDTSLTLMRYFTPSNLYLLYHGLMNCFPGRYKAIYLVHESLGMSAMWTVVKTFISHKLKQRISFSSSPKDLLDHFPPSVLPVEYGGVLEDHYMMEWSKEANRQLGGFPLSGQSNYY